jgi:hypothetical protein
MSFHSLKRPVEILDFKGCGSLNAMPARLSETLCSKTLDSIEGKLHKAIGAFNAPRMQGAL